MPKNKTSLQAARLVASIDTLTDELSEATEAIRAGKLAGDMSELRELQHELFMLAREATAIGCALYPAIRSRENEARCAEAEAAFDKKKAGGLRD